MYNFHKYEEDEKKRKKFKQFRQEYLMRLFKASPGFDPRHISSRKSKAFKSQTHERKLNSDWKIHESDSLPYNQFASQKLIKLSITKYSRDEDKLPKYKTLEGGNVDLHEENGQKILNFNPKMKRSKTPSVWYTQKNFRNYDYSKLNPQSYYDNIPGFTKGGFFRETPNHQHGSKEEIKRQKEQVSDSKCLDTGQLESNHNSTNGIHREISSLIKSRFSNFSSLANIQKSLEPGKLKKEKK